MTTKNRFEAALRWWKCDHKDEIKFTALDVENAEKAIVEALRIAAYIEKHMPELKALVEAGENATGGRWWIDNGITVTGLGDNFGIRPDRGDNAYFVVSSANTRPIIKGLVDIMRPDA